MAKRFVSLTAMLVFIWSLNPGALFAQAPSTPPQQPTPGAPPKSPFETMTSGMKKADDFWTVYYKDQQLLVDFKPSHLKQNFIVLTSIARGISTGQVLGGMTWGFGDDVIWSFEKVGEKLHVL